MPDNLNNDSSLLKWILVAVGGGIVALGGFAQVTFQSFMVRNAEDTKFLRAELKSSLDNISAQTAQGVKAQEVANANQAIIIRAIDAQTPILKAIEEGQRRGVWRDEPKTKTGDNFNGSIYRQERPNLGPRSRPSKLS